MSYMQVYMPVTVCTIAKPTVAARGLPTVVDTAQAGRASVLRVASKEVRQLCSDCRAEGPYGGSEGRRAQRERPPGCGPCGGPGGRVLLT